MSGRYAKSERRVHVAPGGARIAYLVPRILPQPAAGAPLATTTVTVTEIARLDLIAYRTLRDPLLAWRLSDANAAMDPFALCAELGAVLAVPPVGL